MESATDANQGAIGYATNGVAIFGPYNSGCGDATFEEIQTMDYCLGHPANGNYHYHYFSKATSDYSLVRFRFSRNQKMRSFEVKSNLYKWMSYVVPG